MPDRPAKLFGKVTTTAHGFNLIRFKDLYGERCSLQHSLLATEEAVWLGVDDPVPRILASDVPGASSDAVGWVNIELPARTMISSRMHLSRGMARELGKALLIFADTGELPKKSS